MVTKIIPERSLSASTFFAKLSNRLSFLNLKCYADELIIAKEHFAEIGDDLDFTFVDLIDGIDPLYTYRRPKPPTPPPREPSPVKTVEAAAVEGAAPAAEGGAAPAEDGAEGLVAAAPAAPKEPSPFELQKHFPPDGAEVPFVKSYEDPNASKPSPTPSPAPEEAPAPVEEAPATEEAPAPETEATAAEEAPAAEAPAEETTAADAPAEEAPASEA